jgi:hypothetical protein
MANQKLQLTRNLRDHYEFRKGNPPTGEVFCSRCADVWCRRNITPTALLPQQIDLFGQIRQTTCPEMIRDLLLPVDLGR